MPKAPVPAARPWPLPESPETVSRAIWYARKQLSPHEAESSKSDRMISQEKLAIALGVNRVTVARWETYKETPTAERIWQAHELVSTRFRGLFLKEPLWMMRGKKRQPLGKGLIAYVSAADQRWLERRAPLFAWAMLFWHDAVMRRQEWLEMLQASPRLLDGVPSTQTELDGDFVSGADVGQALLTARHGARFGQLRTSVDKIYPERRSNAGAGALSSALSLMFGETHAGVRYVVDDA